MVFPSAWARHSILYRIANTDEVAQTDICTTSAAGDEAAQLSLSGLQDLVTAWVSVCMTSGIIWPTYSQIVGAKSASLDSAGHYTQEPTVFSLGSPIGGSSSSTVPAQASIVLSLNAAGTLGFGNAGRMYMPHTMLTHEMGTPRSSAAVAEGIAIAGATFVGAVNDLVAGGSPGSAVRIISQKIPSAPKLVTRVRVGRVTDTQRRRRNQLDEDRQVATVS